MASSRTTEGWDVRTNGQVVVVELPRGLTLDKETGEQINAAFADAVEREHTESVLTLLRVEEPLSSGLFEEVTRGAQLAAENDIKRWAITVERQVKGMAFKSNLDDLDTQVFEDEDEARAWL
jgi:hypothetical protein